MYLTIKSYNGLDVLGGSLISDIRQISIAYRDGVIRIGLIASNNTRESIDITRPLENFKFLGLSHIPYTLGNYYKQGDGWIDVNINENTTLYEMLKPTTETETPTDNIGIICYTNTSEPNRVDKTQFLIRHEEEIIGTFRDGFSITEPSIVITSQTLPNFNYVQIPVLNNRYYYVNNISNISKNVWQLDLSIDVLYTYRNKIYNLSAFVDRNEFIYEPNIINKEITVEQGYDVDIKTASNLLFSRSYKGKTYSYVMQGVATTLEEE